MSGRVDRVDEGALGTNLSVIKSLDRSPTQIGMKRGGIRCNSFATSNYSGVLMLLDGKVAVVTGGSRGLGRAMVCAFNDHGAEVVIASRNLGRCKEVANDLVQRGGGRAAALACDVGKWEECDQLVENVYEQFGRIDILVNNAGGSPSYSRLDKVTKSEWDKVIAVNLQGPFRLSATVGQRMANEGGGAIINISSKLVDVPVPAALPYAMAKAGLNTLTEGLAQAYGPKVRVNTIQCGNFKTEGSDYWIKKSEYKLIENMALGRVGVAEEIAGAAVYFASDLSSFCTGATLNLDGGMSYRLT